MFGKHLTPYLKRLETGVEAVGAGDGVTVDELLPGPDSGDTEAFHALSRLELADEASPPLGWVRVRVRV